MGTAPPWGTHKLGHGKLVVDVASESCLKLSAVRRSPAGARRPVPRGPGRLAPLHHLQPAGTLPSQEPGAGGGTWRGDGGTRTLGLAASAACRGVIISTTPAAPLRAREQ